MTRKYNITLKAPPCLCVRKIQYSRGVSRQIQHLASPRAILISQHTPSYCIFRTHTWRYFNSAIYVNYDISEQPIKKIFHNIRGAIHMHVEAIFVLKLLIAFFSIWQFAKRGMTTSIYSLDTTWPPLIAQHIYHDNTCQTTSGVATSSSMIKQQSKT